MANNVKRGPDSNPNALSVGDWAIGLSNGMGPTASTDFKKGLEIPEGGYAIYSSNIDARIALNDTELVEILRELGADAQEGDKAAAIRWARTNNVLVLNQTFENIVTDGLVINLDASKVHSYVEDKPTTNVVTNTDLNTGWSKGYQSNIVYNDIAPPQGVNSQVVGFTKSSSSSYWYSYGDYAPQVPGQVYTPSIYVKTNDPNFQINYYTANNSETGRVWGPHITVPNDGKWHRVVWNAFTNPTNSQSDSLSFNMRMSGEPNHESSKTWLCAPQLEPGTEATPFVVGTRTQSTEWIDLSPNANDVILYNEPTFTGNSIAFDGVDDHGRDSDGSLNGENFDGSGFTIGGFIKLLNEPGAWRSTFNVRSRYNYNHIDIRNSNGYGRITINYYPGTTDINAGFVDINENEWHHLVGTWDGSELKLYINGQQAGSVASMNSLNLGDSPKLRIGMAYSDNRFVNDEFKDIKIYRRGLSADEIAQNYYGGPIVTDGLIFNADASNLVSYVEGETIAKSLVGNITGDLLNAVGYSTNNGGAWTFRSADDGIRFTPSLDLSGYSDITINGWIKVTEGGAWFRWFSGAQNTGYHFPDLAILNNGDIGYIHQSMPTGWVDTNQSIGLNNWAYVSYIFKTNGNVEIYINGEHVHSADYASGTFPSNFNFMMGNRYDLNGEAITGQIAQTTIYSKGLTQEEILQNYNAQVARFK